MDDEQEQKPEQNPEQPPDTPLLSDPAHLREDCRLIARFGVRDQARDLVADRLLSIIFDRYFPEYAGGRHRHVKPREAIAAVRALMNLDKLNMEQEQYRAKVLAEVKAEQAAINGMITDEAAQRLTQQIRAMDSSILPPEVIYREKPHSNGNGKPKQ